jgi:RNA polymerase sigma-70 factor (ECF subfamily)
VASRRSAVRGGVANRFRTEDVKTILHSMDSDRLFAEYQDELVRYLTRLTGDPELAQDAAQESFLRMLRNPPSRQDNPRAWLYAVATNVVRDDRRKRATAAKLSLTAGTATMADSPPDPQARLEQIELCRTVRQMLAKLSDTERTILLMRGEGFKHSEIAQAVGTTTKSVGTMIARALRKLASEIDTTVEALS